MLWSVAVPVPARKEFKRSLKSPRPRACPFSLNEQSLLPTYPLLTMLGHQFAHSSAPIRKVKEVQFGILSPEEIVSTLFVTWAY